MRPYSSSVRYHSFLSSDLFGDEGHDYLETKIPIVKLYDVDNPPDESEDDKYLKTHSYIYSSSTKGVYILWVLFVILGSMEIVWLLILLLRR